MDKIPMTDFAELKRLAEEIADKLASWAELVNIPSGDFVNDDLRRGSSTILDLLAKLAIARNDALEDVAIMVKNLMELGYPVDAIVSDIRAIKEPTNE